MAGAAGLLVLLLAALLLGVAVLAAIVCRDVLLPPRHTAGYAAARGMPFDPGEAGLAFESWTLDLPGAELAVWEIDAAPRGHRGAPTMVFVHDWGESRLDVLARLGTWKSAGARLILYDRAGHGSSSGAALRRGEYGDLLALLAECGQGPFVLVGRGTGAAVAIAAAARSAPGRVAGVVAERPVVALRAWVRRRLRDAGQYAWPVAELACTGLWMSGAGLGDAAADAGRLPGVLLVVDGDDTQRLALAAPRGQAVQDAAPESLLALIEALAGAAPQEPSAAPPAASASLADELVAIATFAYRHARRLVILVVGISVVLIGVVMIVLPGPASLIIPLGLAILGLEFAWARRWLRGLKSLVVSARDRLTKKRK